MSRDEYGNRIEPGDVIAGRKVTELNESVVAIEDGEPVRKVTVTFYPEDSNYIVGGGIPEHIVQTKGLETFLEMIGDE